MIFLLWKISFKNTENILKQNRRILIIRHDVDRLPENALKTAEIEHSLNISSSYYFRMMKKSFNPDIIRSITDLDHEIGYHYEDLASANGDYNEAFRQFKINLFKIRKLYPVKTICMHGNPLSKWDNRLMWEKFNYKELDIICEPYFDIDYSKVFYLTDTGRKWNANSVNVRDKIGNSKHFKHCYKSTDNIIYALKTMKFPKIAIINSHPERWSDSIYFWLKQLIIQNLKNTIKFIINLKKTNN